MNVTLTYFYCTDREGEKNTFSSLAKSLLAQILKQNAEKPEIVAFLHEECLKSCKATLGSHQDCVNILGTLLNALDKTFIIIDGLDECELKERKSILKFFLSAIEKNSAVPGKLRCLFVSQDLKDIRNGLKDAGILHLTEKHVLQDIRNYAVRYTLKIGEVHKGLPQPAKDYIVKLVCEGSDGMFLFAKLVLKNLYAQKNLQDIYNELREDVFPHGLEKAYGTFNSYWKLADPFCSYTRILNRILDNSDPIYQDTARKLLGWIVCVKRPLKWQEMQGALSIDVIAGQVSFENRRLAGDAGDICGSLVELSLDNRVQLVHSSARQ
jgi:hypothetical protein